LKSNDFDHRENGRKKRNKIFFMSEKAIEYKLMKGRILVNRGMR
jgi:hypothetical protein